MTDGRLDRALSLLTVPLMVAAGAIVAVQSQVNSRLAAHLGSGMRAGLLAAVISFGTGWVLLATLTSVLPQQRRKVVALRDAVDRGAIRPALLLGGLFGAFLVACQGLVVGTIGVALFHVALTAGQSASALAVDHAGLGPSGKQQFSVPRAIAALFAIAAVVLATAERTIAGVSFTVVAFTVLAILAGGGSSVQQAINGRVSHVAGPWVTTLNNFTVGTVGLLAVFALSFLRPGELTGFPGNPGLYVGGLLGITFIWLAALLVRYHGVLVLGLAMIAGQVIGAELIEAFSAHTEVGAAGYAAGGLTVLGVLVALGVRRRTAVA